MALGPCSPSSSAARAERDRLAEAHKRQAATLRTWWSARRSTSIVQELVVTTPGQSVGSNQPLMKLVRPMAAW